MSEVKSPFRITAIILFIFLCQGSWYKCMAEDADDPNSANTADSVNAPEPNSAMQNQQVDSNTPAIQENDPNENDKSSGDAFNKEFSPILYEYVYKDGKVNYARLRRYRLELKAMLAQLAILDPQEYESWTKNEKIAFWINTYNTLMLSIIVDNYPIESRRLDRLWWPPNSIRHIPPRSVVGSSKWNNYKFIVMDEEFNLYEIEKRFFRNKFRDPRIFLALTLASVDGPPLKKGPYYGKDLDKQLDEQVERYLSTPSGISIDRDKRAVYLSVLFEPKLPWFGMEFLPKYSTDKKFKSQPKELAAVLNFITGYISKQDVDYLETGNYTVSFKAYDWRINE